MHEPSEQAMRPEPPDPVGEIGPGDRGRSPGPLRLGRREFAVREPVVMAIVNRTPDSFFDKGATFALGAAVEAASRAVAAGAGIVDIGGVKAGQGAEVGVAEEIARVVDVVAAVRAAHPDVVISVDTWRASVASACIEAGADLINDAWEGPDPELPAVVAAAGVGLVCTHAGHLPPRTDPHRAAYADVVADVVATLTAMAERAVAAGVRPDAVIIDPGHDFGKNTRHSLLVTRRLDELVATGWPVLVALSRKDFVGETLDLPVDERLTGTLATTAVSAWLGARIFRAHDVVATKQCLDMVATIKGDREPALNRRGLA
jgi:dihydropteroate synthase